MEYPENLEVTRAYRGSRAPEVFYYVGLTQSALGNQDAAKKAWRESAAELIGTEDVPRATVDNGAVLVYYQALSLGKLGQPARAKALFASLASAAAKAETRPAGQEFFAKFGERQSPRARLAMAHYVGGLAAQGAGDNVKAKAEFQKAVALNAYLLDARTRLANMKQ